MQGNNYQIDKEPLLNIPIPKISQSSQQPFIQLVDKIIAGKKAGRDTQILEDKIDLMVYKLYELTCGEAKIIDPEIDAVLAKFGLCRTDFERKNVEELIRLKQDLNRNEERV